MNNRVVGGIGLALLAVLMLTAVFAPQIAPYSPYAQTGAPFEAPSRAHLLGANDVGQDILSELIYGTRNSLLVGFTSAAVAMTIGVLVGVLSGWYGGRVDRLLSKATSFFMTVPFLPSVIILSTFSDSSVLSMSIILGALSWTGVARVLRSATMQIRSSAYVRIIKGMGASDGYILTHHVLRELLPLIAYRVVTRVKSGILSESTMSFLGLGNPVAKSWGSIIYYAQAKNALLTGAWVWWIVPPGLCICLVSLSLMLIGYSIESPSDRRKEADKA